MTRLLSTLAVVLAVTPGCDGSQAGGEADGEDCTLGCEGRQCGTVCGETCGSCASAEVCNAKGACQQPSSQATSFFVTSVGNGQKGGDFGGLAGADAFCQSLAHAAGIQGKTWRAYASTSSENARDRIGAGPWLNAREEVVAADSAELHAVGLPASLVIDESGGTIDYVNAHDIITGSKEDGTFDGASCADYTSSAAADQTAVGHADGGGVGQGSSSSWNAAHSSNGCDSESLQGTASQSHLYCFAL
jgi:hypothetical protein